MKPPNSTNLLILSILIIYLAIKIGIGIFHKTRAQKSLNSYAIADRDMGSFLLGLRLGATNVAGGAVVGAIGLSWITGVSMIWYFLALAAGTAVYAIFLSGQFRISEAITPSQWFGAQYGGRTWTITTIAACLNCFVFLILQITSATIGIHYILDLPAFASILIVAGVFIFYTWMGGFRSVVWTDILSYTITIVSFMLIVIIAMGKFSHKLSLLPTHYSNFGYIGIVAILSYFLVGISWGANVVTLQTSAAARSKRNARNLGLWAAFWMCLPAGLFPLSGMLAKAAFPHLSTANFAMPALIVATAPSWLQGIALAGIVGASMSAGAGQLLSFSNVVVIDVIKRIKPSITRRASVSWSRITVLSGGILAMIISLKWGELPPTVVSISLLGSSLALAYLVPLFVGLRWRVNGRDMDLIVIGGMITAIVYTAISLAFHVSVASGAVLPTIGVSTVLMILVLLMHGKKPQQRNTEIDAHMESEIQPGVML